MRDDTSRSSHQHSRHLVRTSIQRSSRDQRQTFGALLERPRGQYLEFRQVSAEDFHVVDAHSG